MRLVALAVAIPVAAYAQVGSPPYGVQVGSGTVSAASPSVSFSDGPFVVPNPSGILSLLGLVGEGVSTPTCAPVPASAGGPLSTNQCDFYVVTVNAASVAASKNLRVTVAWPDALNPNDQSEFDLYVYDAAGNLIGVASSGVATPRVVTLPIPADGTQFTVQVVPFNPAGFSYTATIALVDKPPVIPTGVDAQAARFKTYLSPAGLGDNAGEPSVGVDWIPQNASFAHGTVNPGGVTFFQSGPNTLRVSFDQCSSPAGHAWDDVSTALVQQFVVSDPIGTVDSTTGRVYSLDLIGFEGNSFMAYSDDDGQTWTPAQGGGIPGGPDHETLGVGPWAQPAPPTASWPHAVYYCGQDIETEAQCSRSDDGGQTFGPGVPIYQTTACAANATIHGHVKVGPDGTVYVPSGSCSVGPGVAFSKDNGITWGWSGPAPASTFQNLDPSVAIDAANNVYLIWLDGGSNHAFVSVSTDGLASWSAPFDVGGSFGIQNADFVISTAGDAGRAAVGFVGSTTGGDPGSAGFPGTWDLYLATTYDSGQTWTTQDATPNDPVQLGCIWTGGGSNPCRNLLDFNDMRLDSQGRIVVAYAKGCLESANCSLATASQHGPPYTESEASKAAIALQSGGKRLFAAFDPPASAAPGNPRLEAATVDSITGNVQLSWSAPDDGGAAITAYNIYRGTSAGGETLYDSIAATRTTYADTGVNASATYYYSVTAVNAAGESGHCGELAAAPPVAQGDACKLPGVQVASDAAGDQTGAPANAPLDLTALDVAEPYPSPVGASSLVFTLKVANLGQLTALPPNAEWKVAFSVQDTNGIARTVFVEADTNDITKPFGEFSYGYTSGTTDFGQGSTGVTGIFDTSASQITIFLDTSKPIAFTPGIGSTDLPFTVNIGPGSALNAMFAQTVLLLGAQPGGIGGGLLETVDTTSKGSFSVRGNAACRPNNPPVASLQAVPNSGCAPLTSALDGSQSFDPDNDAIASYAFTFGDGASSSGAGASVSHTYAAAGAYPASLHVTDARGAVSNNVAQAQVFVWAIPGAPAITAPATVKAKSAGNVASVPADSGAAWTWSISNGTLTAGQGTNSVTFTAGAKGTLTLTARETSSHGCASPVSTKSVSVGR